MDNEVKKSPKPSYDKKRLVDLAEIHPTTVFIIEKVDYIRVNCCDYYKTFLKQELILFLLRFSRDNHARFDTTIPVTINDMVHHTAAVRRGIQLPGGCRFTLWRGKSFFDRLLDSARRLMQCGADAVKIEGGKDIADDIEKLVATGIPVMGHIGSSSNCKRIGGYRKFGTTREEADELYTDAISLEEVGCFAIIAEMMDEEIAAHLADQILPPLIGIGSGHQTDGEILVTHDLLGLTPSPLPSFVKPCVLGLDGLNALQDYVVNLTIPLRKMNFCVLGVGAWGNAMAVYLSKIGHSVSLVPRRVEHALKLSSERRIKSTCPELNLIMIYGGLFCKTRLNGINYLFFACPSHALRKPVKLLSFPSRFMEIKRWYCLV